MNFLLEIGTEELPANDVWSAINQLETKTPYLLKAKGIMGVPEKNIKIYGTPRRLVVYIQNIATDKKTISPLIPALIKSLKFEKSMRWLPDSNLIFSRPIRWLVALLDDHVVKSEFAQIKTGRNSFGPRFLSSPKIKIFSAKEYFEQLKTGRVIIDQERRKEVISKKNAYLAKKVNGKAVTERALLNEVAQLVEHPVCILGKFNKKYLKIPQEVTMMVMKKHQRYFPIVGKNGRLIPYFIAVANHLGKNSSLIIKGNEKVIEARLNDGAFFYNQDRQKKLEQFIPELKNITFHEKLGSVYGKIRRLEKTVYKISLALDLKLNQAVCRRAARLAKADLATLLVREFPSLQGKIGAVYAAKDKENKEVAKAIGEHYHPRFGGDKPPQSTLGQALALADKIDTLCGFFAAGIRPAGSKDPYGLRRGAIGIIHILNKTKASPSLSELFSIVIPVLPIKMSQKSQEEAIEFIQRRMEAELKKMGIGDNIINAIIKGPMAQNVFFSFELAKKLNAQSKNKKFKDFVRAAKRAQNISQGVNPKGKINPKLFKEKEEKELFRAYKKANLKVNRAINDRSFDNLLAAYADIAEKINRFFEKVMVMSEDKRIRQNRLHLLARISVLTKAVFISGEL